MGKKRKQPRKPKPAAPTSSYTDPEGNVLVLRQTLTPATVRTIVENFGSAAASREDAWHRRNEMLFERLAVSWEIAGLPLTGQAMLLGRYRMSGGEQQDWVRQTITAHVNEFFPDLDRL